MGRIRGSGSRQGRTGRHGARLIACLLAAALVPAAGTASAGAPVVDPIQKIRHVVIIMQENRSFDSYFGTFPGANGIPMRRGVPAGNLIPLDVPDVDEMSELHG